MKSQKIGSRNSRIRYSVVGNRLRFIPSFIGARIEVVGCIISAVHKPLETPV